MKVLRYVLLLGTVSLIVSCAGTSKRIPTVQFQQYTFEQGRNQLVQTKSDVIIQTKVLRPTDVYDYPQYFSFDRGMLPESIGGSMFVRTSYKASVGDKCWDYVLGDPQGKKLLTAVYVKIKNNTGHIIRMKDARVYLIVEGEEPMPAIDSVSELKRLITGWENDYAATQRGGIIKIAYPVGLYSAIIDQNIKSFKLINDVGREVLPKFSLEGLLVFPVAASFDKVTLSFFDITTRTDAAGTPTEKTQFDFALVREPASMWYDATANRWKLGYPPTATGR
jgi:hypothetical protein